MIKKISFLLLMLLLVSLVQGQPVKSKTCKTCGLPLKECQYRGRHPQAEPTPAQPQRKPEKPTPTVGSLYITSTPSGAAIKVDGKYKGESPLTIESQRPGNYTVSFSAEGYESVSRTATVTAGKTVTCHANLKKKQSIQPPSQQANNQQSTASNQGIRLDGNTLRFTVDGTEYSYKMVYVSGGTYTMGCTSEQGSDCHGNEEPAHSVTVSGFYMGQTEVTQALWKAVMGSNPSYWKGNTLPVEWVTYNDVKEFIGKLNSQTGASFRLPTEEEWEFAARGGNSSRGYKYSGSDNLGSVAWYDGNSGNKTHPVAQKQANELGLYDMSGNVWEWCSSLWCDDYNSARSGSYRVFRGGGWSYGARGCRVSSRNGDRPLNQTIQLGLRLAR